METYFQGVLPVIAFTEQQIPTPIDKGNRRNIILGCKRNIR
ncbi:MAG: hypothetical protein ACTHKF_01180 [Candidatus Nitrosocosmicus sp.]